MRSHALALLVLFASASAAHAATLDISLNQGGVYNVGDTIEITVTGDSEGETTLNILGLLNFSNPAITNLSPAIEPHQNTLTAFGGIPWTVARVYCMSTYCKMFDAIHADGINGGPAENLLVATVSLLATAPGISTLTWETNPASGAALTFFSLTNAAGATITVVPEPATALLLTLGLAGLTWRRSR